MSALHSTGQPGRASRTRRARAAQVVRAVAATATAAAVTAAATTAAATTGISSVPAAALGATPVVQPIVSHSFDPGSVTFVSLSTGFALGTVPCRGPGECLALRETTDGGQTWSDQQLPVALLSGVNRRDNGYPVLGVGGGSLTVRFADPQDGWISGAVPAGGTLRSVLWSTHDGGRNWHDIASVPGLSSQAPVMDLEAARGVVYALGQMSGNGVGAALASSPVGADHWHAVPTPSLGFPAGGANPVGDLVLQGGSGWLVEGNDRGISGSARLLPDGRWAAWSPPCSLVGDSYAVPAAADASHLYALCQMGGFASALSAHAPKGAKLGSTWLYGSSDGGLSFHPVVQLGAGYPGATGAQQVQLGPVAAASPGHLFVERYAKSAQLLGSFDGGRHWQVVYGGNVSYVGFTSPAQGVAITQPSASAQSPSGMVMTRDGGRHWHRVSF